MKRRVGTSIGRIIAAFTSVAGCASTPPINAAPIEHAPTAIADAAPATHEIPRTEKAQDAGAEDPSVSECASACRGFGGPEVARAVRDRAASAKHCYNDALRVDRTLRGRLTVAIRISTTGRVCLTKTTANETGSDALASCVMQAFEPPFDATPINGCLNVNIPFAFLATDAGAPPPAGATRVQLP